MNFIFIDKKDFEVLRFMPLRCQAIIKDLAYQAMTKCDDLLNIESVEKEIGTYTINFRRMAKSGINGDHRLVEIMNSTWNYSSEDAPIAWRTDDGFTIRCCNHTNCMSKQKLTID